MRVYVAGRYAERALLRELAQALGRRGHEVVSRWLTEHTAVRMGDIGQARDYALEDLLDIQRADLFVLVGSRPSQSGGRHVEFGYALALGKRMCVIGKRHNIFHCLPQVKVFASTQDFMYWLDTITGRIRPEVMRP